MWGGRQLGCEFGIEAFSVLVHTCCAHGERSCVLCEDTLCVRRTPAQVCATRYEFVEPLLKRLSNIDVQRLSRSARAAAAAAAAAAASAPAEGSSAAGGEAGKSAAAAPVRRNDTGAVCAARERYLQRKQQAGGKK